MAAYTAVDNPELYFQTVLYTGDGSGDLDITLPGDEDMVADLVWQCTRNTTSERNIYDIARGIKNRMHSDTGEAENVRNGVISFDSDGFSVGDHSGSNTNTNTYVNWCWNSQGGAGSSNTAGSINTTTTSVGQTQGFSISTYTGNGTAGATIGHGLGAKPAFIIQKNRDDAENWQVQHKSHGAENYLTLSTSNGVEALASRWNDTEPTTTLISLGSDSSVNLSGEDMVIYAWAEVQGFSKFGKYIGNGSANGAFVYLGFRPAWVLVKQTNTDSEDWAMWDNKRDPTNDGASNSAITNDSDQPADTHIIDFLSNGFKLRSTDNIVNDTDDSYIFAAFAEAPFVNSNGVPNNAR